MRDRRLKYGSISDLLKCIQIGLLCVQENVACRPTMSSVVLMLSPEYHSTLPSPSRPGFYMSLNEDLHKSMQNSESVGTYSANDVSITDLDPR